MRHQKKTKKLNRPKPHREAMLANLATSLFKHRQIETTDARAKELRRLADHLITLAKGDTLASRRLVAQVIHDKETHKRLFTEIAPSLRDRTSGYTRVIKKGLRRGDASLISVVQLLTPKAEPQPETQTKDAGKAKKSKPMAEAGASKPKAVKKAAVKTGAKKASKKQSK